MVTWVSLTNQAFNFAFADFPLSKFFIQPGFSKRKQMQTTSCLMLIGGCPFISLLGFSLTSAYRLLPSLIYV